jgi:cell division septation protein DedD
MSIRSILRFLIPLFAIIFLLRTCYAIQLSREKSKQTGVSTTTTDNTNTVVYGGNAQNEGIAGGMPGASSIPSSYDNGNFAAKSGEVRKSSEAVLDEVKGSKSVSEVPALSNGLDDLSTKTANAPKISSNTSSDDIFSTPSATAKTSYDKASAKSATGTKSVTKRHHATKVIKRSSPGFLVLAGSFKDHAHAEEQLEKLQKMGYKSAEIVKFEKTDFETVCVAKFNTEASAKKLDAELEKAKIDAYVHAKK